MEACRNQQILFLNCALAVVKPNHDCQFLYYISQFFKSVSMKLELRNAVTEGVSDHRYIYSYFCGYLVQIYSPFDWNFN